MYNESTTALTYGDDGLEAVANSLYTFIPVLLIEIALSLFSNTVLLTLIVRSYRSLTSLNIFLLSVSIMNLVTFVNQVTLFGLILNRNKSVPHIICHFTIGIQTMSNYGISLFQLVIAYNRFQTAKNPLYWESDLTKAWVMGGVVWGIAIVWSVLESILHIGGVDGEIRTCFWPSMGENLPYKFSLRLCLTVAMLGVFVATYSYHRKTMKLLFENRRLLEFEMEMVSDINNSKTGLKTSPEKTTLSLIVVFVVHMITFIFPQFYDTFRLFVILIRSVAVDKINDPSPTFLLISLTCISLFTTTSPIFLMLVSQRFKENVKSIFMCVWDVEKDNKDIDQILAKKEIWQKRQASMRARPKVSHIFIGESSKEKYCNMLSRRSTETSDNSSCGQVDDAPEAERDESIAEITKAAINDGLVIATGKDKESLNNFFKEEMELQYQEALASAEALEVLLL